MGLPSEKVDWFTPSGSEYKKTILLGESKNALSSSLGNSQIYSYELHFVL
jgi:hypothetical protein